jgi:protoporphyrinogen oxidase
MKIAIIGAGFTGLASALELVKKGHQVTIYEKGEVAGGLAGGFKNQGWDWILDKHYHHVFESDHGLLDLLEELGLKQKLKYYQTKSSTLVNNKSYQLDSPISLLKFSQLSLVSRIRTGVVSLFLKLVSNGKFLEKYKAKDFIIRFMGQQSWEILWRPLFDGKFNKLGDEINMAWFWARIKVRSENLGYYDGGFQALANDLVEKLKQRDISIKFNQSADYKNLANFFDKVLVATNHDDFNQNLESLGSMTLVLELKKPFLKDKAYWLNVNEKNWPFIAVIEHTNLVNKEKYGNNYLVYLGKYLSIKDSFFKLDKEQVLKEYEKYLAKLNPNFKDNLVSFWLFKDKFTQPVTRVNHSSKVPEIRINKNIYWACMYHIYPYDRAINNAIYLGKKAARIINS